MEVDRHADRALYLQLADVLRDEITSGRLPPGGRLPSEADLITEHGVSRGTVREAFGILRNEGLVAVEHGRGAFVRRADQRPTLRHIANSEPPMRYRSAFEHTAVEQGCVPTIREVSRDRVPATDEVAEHLDVPAGTTIDRSRAVYFVDGRPVQLVTAYQPIHDGEAEAEGLTEEVAVRMPTREERRLLQLDDGSPVIVLHRTLHNTDEAPAEWMEAIIAGERQQLIYHLN